MSHDHWMAWALVLAIAAYAFGLDCHDGDQDARIAALETQVAK